MPGTKPHTQSTLGPVGCVKFGRHSLYVSGRYCGLKFFSPLVRSTHFCRGAIVKGRVQPFTVVKGSAEGLVESGVYAASVTASIIMVSNSMGVSFPSRR